MKFHIDPNCGCYWCMQGEEMNTCVSDEQVIINIQGIRNVTWGESTGYDYGSKGGWYVTVTYKGSHNVFKYKTEGEARSLFNKVREAMDKEYNATTK